MSWEVKSWLDTLQTPKCLVPRISFGAFKRNNEWHRSEFGTNLFVALLLDVLRLSWFDLKDARPPWFTWRTHALWHGVFGVKTHKFKLCSFFQQKLQLYFLQRWRNTKSPSKFFVIWTAISSLMSQPHFTQSRVKSWMWHGRKHENGTENEPVYQDPKPFPAPEESQMPG